MILPSPTAGAPWTSAAAFDRAAPPPAPDARPASAGDASPDAGPDVVVTLGGGQPGRASTYDATGRLPGGLSLNELGANGPASLVRASETIAVADRDGSADANDANGGADAGALADAGPA